MRLAHVICMFFFLLNFAQAQYYFKDIISNRQISTDMREYKKVGVRQIKIISYEENGEVSKHFFCEKKLSKDFKKTSLFTKTGIAGRSLLITFYNEKLQVIRTYDSSDIAINESRFYYDDNDRLTRVFSISKSADDDYINQITEEHIYGYSDQLNLPNELSIVKNNRDTTLVLFSFDENKNISVEKDTRTAAKYYYYYDNSNRLTDIVHANEYSEKMIANYIFEYDSAGRIVRQTSTEEGSNNYLVWLYEYENNLRKKEKVYNKKGMFLGKIEYQYKQ